MRKSKCVFILIYFLFSIQSFPIDRVLAASNIAEVPLTVKQNFEVKNAKKNIQLTGTYELHALDTESPMPENAKDELYSFSLEGDREITIPLQYSHGGVYRYRLYQIINDKEFYHYDKSCYNITVYVKNDEGGSLIAQVVAEKDDGKKYGDLQFQNSYYSGETSETTLVNTGDYTNITAYILTGMGALFIIILLSSFKRRYQKEQ